jgi:glyoxylase-like metal-dependent hydrolase (beta-lactamase superfamily II)
MHARAAAAPPRWEPRTQRAGEWELTALSSGWLRLDGGSMWGVVPATMWREWTPPDEDNTIRLACRPFLARRGKDVVVIEPGIGTRWEEKWRKIYRIESVDTLEQTLARVGVAPGQVTHVVDSHCHWDHIGSQVVERNGRLEPLFPNARHFAPKIEIAMAKKPGHARAASYRAEDVLAIEKSGLLESYEGTRELLPGLVAHVLGGHSDGVSVITLGEGAERSIFWSDVVPTTHHVQPPYIMAYDLDVVRSFEVRSQWLEQAARGGWLGMFFHDEHVPFAKIVKDGKRYRCEPVSS